MEQLDIFARLEELVAEVVVNPDLQRKLGLDIDAIDIEEVASQASTDWWRTFGVWMLGLIQTYEEVVNDAIESGMDISVTLLDKLRSLVFYGRRLLVLFVLSRSNKSLLEGVEVERGSSCLELMVEMSGPAYGHIFEEFQAEISKDDELRQLLGIPDEQE